MKSLNMSDKQVQRMNCDAGDLSPPERERMEIEDSRIKKLHMDALLPLEIVTIRTKFFLETRPIITR